jgi:hypothetical protein
MANSDFDLQKAQKQSLNEYNFLQNTAPDLSKEPSHLVKDRIRRENQPVGLINCG